MEEKLMILLRSIQLNAINALDNNIQQIYNSTISGCISSIYTVSMQKRKEEVRRMYIYGRKVDWPIEKSNERNKFNSLASIVAKSLYSD